MTDLIVWTAAVVGWVMNLVKLFGDDYDTKLMFLGRVIGVFFMPLGAVLGFF